MAKATTQKKTATKKLPKKPIKKAAKKAAKKTAKTKAVSTGNKVGRKLFDGQNEKAVVRKLELAIEAGASNNQAARMAGISPTALSDYLKKNPEFQNSLDDIRQVVKVESHFVLNSVLRECEKTTGVYDRDGNKIEYTPTNRAVSTAKYHLKSLDPRYMPKQLNGNIEIPVGNALTPEREAEIAEALKNWGTKHSEEDHYVVE